VVSEWESQTIRGGRVGNAYPLLNLTTGKVVDQPQEEFANAGAIFLMNRGSLTSWDFILVRPRWNDRYKNSGDRDCCYVPARQPDLLTNPGQAENVAVVLEHPAFDLASPTRQILNPRYNVTPIFFVQKNQTIIGPLLRDVATLTPMEDVQRIDWRPAREDGIVYEFTQTELAQKNIQLARYTHPDPSLNRVLSVPIQLAFGRVLQATSLRPHDALPTPALVEWYVQHCPTVEVPSQLLTSLKAAFRGKPGDDPIIQAARLRKLEREMATHTAFQEQRERFARQYVESEQGQQRVGELIEQVVARKASEVQVEVDKRQSQLAARRDELDALLARAEQQYQESLRTIDARRAAADQEVEQLKEASRQLRASLSGDVSQFAARIQEEFPLFAALAATRPSEGATQASPLGGASGGPPQPIRFTVQEFRPVPPSTPVAPVEDEGNLVDALHRELARRDLHFARDFVANVYTCLKSDPLNLIIGPPGFGKSMLVSALARSLGHANAFLRIAVRRSWSEDRFLLGFFDSFHGRYDPGATGLVPHMLQADADWRQSKTGVYIVLLDEFNLAAPEYYFSQLLQTLPSDDPSKEIRLYDTSAGGGAGDGFPSRVTLSPNLRFWGTINYDETTERLSPRTLDRTGMIFLGDADVRPTLDEAREPMPGVSAGDLFARFLRDPEDCPEERWDMVSRVIDFLRSTDGSLGPRIELSPRVKQAIKRYLANSTGTLPARTAVDFVVQQRILPVIRGRGDEFFERMTRFGQILSDANLSRSAQHVEEALRRSEQQFGELDFLSY
jgi:energy-coupling factor transporter ATP-binding protein EcfA2